jgi:hypothetical protein
MRTLARFARPTFTSRRSQAPIVPSPLAAASLAQAVCGLARPGRILTGPSLTGPVPAAPVSRSQPFRLVPSLPAVANLAPEVRAPAASPLPVGSRNPITDPANLLPVHPVPSRRALRAQPTTAPPRQSRTPTPPPALKEKPVPPGSRNPGPPRTGLRPWVGSPRPATAPANPPPVRAPSQSPVAPPNPGFPRTGLRPWGGNPVTELNPAERSAANQIAPLLLNSGAVFQLAVDLFV